MGYQQFIEHTTSHLYITFATCQTRLPRGFEIFDCAWIKPIDKLRSFLKRVAIFSSSYFVLLNVQELPSEHQEVIFNFISRPERADAFNLHCIQLGDTILHASPWVKSKIWKNEEIENNSNIKTWINEYVLCDNTFDIVSVITVLTTQKVDENDELFLSIFLSDKSSTEPTK